MVSDRDGIDFFPIDVEQTDWQTDANILSSIRHRVFVEEQGVPLEEEVDEQDRDAIHWLAWGRGNKAMGCARLAGNKLGRMAVLDRYRHQGVGSGLMRAIISHAVRNGIRELILDAQEQATPFYRNLGFEMVGETFQDAGLPHRRMRMDLSRFAHFRPHEPPPPVEGEDRERVLLSTPAEFVRQAEVLVRDSHRILRLFSHSLDPAIYDNTAFCDAIFQLATGHPAARILLLVRDSAPLIGIYHRLVATYHRLTSSIQLRTLSPETETLHTEFMVGDNQSILYIQDPERYRGYYCRYTPLEARRLSVEFDGLWENALPDPEVKRLHI